MNTDEDTRCPGCDTPGAEPINTADLAAEMHAWHCLTCNMTWAITYVNNCAAQRCLDVVALLPHHRNAAVPSWPS